MIETSHRQMQILICKQWGLCECWCN